MMASSRIWLVFSRLFSELFPQVISGHIALFSKSLLKNKFFQFSLRYLHHIFGFHQMFITLREYLCINQCHDRTYVKACGKVHLFSSKMKQSWHHFLTSHLKLSIFSSWKYESCTIKSKTNHTLNKEILWK